MSLLACSAEDVQLKMSSEETVNLEKITESKDDEKKNEENSQGTSKTSLTAEQILAEGAKHCQILHEYVSVIPKLAKVMGNSENKTELYQQNLMLLDPQVKKMRDVHNYVEQLTAFVVEHVKQLMIKSDNLEEKTLTEFTKILDTVLILDYLKTWQAGLNNDFSMYRRAIQHVKKDYNMSDDEALRFFLVNTGNINKGVLKALQTNCAGYWKLFIQVIKFCIKKFDESEDGYNFLRVMVFSIFLIDKELGNTETYPIIKKQIKLSKTSKLFKKHPRIPLYKELPFNVTNYIKACPNFNEKAENSGCAFL